MTGTATLLVYGAPLFIVLAFYLVTRSNNSRDNLSARKQAIADGLTEPASLHPLVDHNKCVGCGACVAACPEQPDHHVLGLINGKAHLIHAADCIGHGACKTACPVGAISLVFGSEKRGVDIPQVGPDFQTNVAGIFIAGELGGMGLIRNAVEQGTQALEAIKRLVRERHEQPNDIIIVGAGPAGFAATLGAHQAKLRYVTLEQDSLGGTVFQFPRGKLVMTAPVNLPLVGKVKLRETSKEALLELWEGIASRTGIRINFNEHVKQVREHGDGVHVVTSKGEYRARALLLAIGRRGTPRKLGVPGEDLPKVVYRLIDPEQYRGSRVLVVGGGDSALEAAVSLAEQPGTDVTISYRSDAFSRAKQKNRQRIEAAAAEKRLRVLLKSNVAQIREDQVSLDWQDKKVKLRNDAVIICAGGILPTGLLKEIGIDVETKYGTA